MKDWWSEFIKQHLPKTNLSPIIHSIIKNTKLLSSSEKELVIGCENLGTKIILESRKKIFEKEFLNFLGKPVSLNFYLIEKTKTQKTPPPLFKYEKEKEEKQKQSGLKEQFTFENFAVSSSNQLAYSAAIAVTENLGKLYNPLFIYGDVGVGKTHLLQAIGNRILEKDLNKKILFCSSEDFVNDLVLAIRQKNTLGFRKKYRQVDLLLIDDIQFIGGKDAAQEELFHTFNKIILNGGQIVFASDRPPHQIKNLEDRLKSRFAGGLIVDIQKPDLELRIAILLIKAKERKIEIDVECARLIAEKITDSRQLEGKLLELSAKALKENTTISKELIEKEFNQQKEKIQRFITPKEIIKIVCLHYNITPNQLKNNSRKETLVLPRQVVMYLLRTVLKLKYEEIALILKRKDHTTIIHGVNKITNLLLKNPSFKEEIERITKNLSLSP